MTRLLLLSIVCLALLTAVAPAQEVVVNGFPEGVGISVGKEFFKPFYPALQAVADSLKHDPLAIGVITGSADGIRYSRDSDAKNPGLAVGRAHLLRNLLITEFGVNPEQLLVQSIDFTSKGPEYRYCSVRLVRTVAEIQKSLSNRIDSLAQRPPLEKHFTEIREVPSPFIEDFGFRFSGGAETSPFGGLPVVSGAVHWKHTVYVEATVGHTFWNEFYTYQTHDLNTKRRLAGAQVTYYPWEELRLGFLGGWLRTEQVSDKYYEYVRLSEGPVVGARYDFFDRLTLTGAWNPSKERTIGRTEARTKNDRFLLSLSMYFELGGGK